MQVGSVPIERRKHGPDVWSFRWREAGPAGRRVHRRIVLGSAEQLKSLASARKMVVGLRPEINVHDVRIRKESITLNDLSRHYQQRELSTAISASRALQQRRGQTSTNRQKIGFSRVQCIKAAGLTWHNRSCGTISFLLRES